jgi:hypothetical protein
MHCRIAGRCSDLRLCVLCPLSGDCFIAVPPADAAELTGDSYLIFVRAEAGAALMTMAESSVDGVPSLGEALQLIVRQLGKGDGAAGLFLRLHHVIGLSPEEFPSVTLRAAAPKLAKSLEPY